MNYFLQQEIKFYSSGNKYIFHSSELCFWCAFNDLSRGCIKFEKAYRLKCRSNLEHIVGNYTLEKYK